MKISKIFDSIFNKINTSYNNSENDEYIHLSIFKSHTNYYQVWASKRYYSPSLNKIVDDVIDYKESNSLLGVIKLFDKSLTNDSIVKETLQSITVDGKEYWLIKKK